jgi:hypothetical protein
MGLISLPICVPPLVIAINNAVHHRFGVVHDGLLVVFFSAALILGQIWVRGFRILVSESEIAYRSGFGGTRVLRIADIQSAWTEMGRDTASAAFYRLVLQSRDSDQPVVINMKVFARHDILKLVEILGDRVVGKPRLSFMEH